MSAITRWNVQTTVAIANGQSTSSAIEIGEYSEGGFQLPAAFTGVAMTFNVSVDGATYTGLNNASGAISLTVAQGKAYAFPADVFAFRFVELVSGSSEAAARSILVSLKG